MATVLITGGAGFLGSHLADYFCEKGDRVLIVDHFQREKIRILPHEADVYRYDFADVRVEELLKKTRPDVVFHLAAQISVTKSIECPSEDARQNILSSLRLLKWCKETGVGKMVFASSGGAIYGDYPIHPTPLVEDALPLSPYGIGKQAFERYLQSAEIVDGFPWAAIRFSNLYGPRQQVTKPVGEGNVISLFLDKLLVTGEPFNVYGDGTASRDYLFASDAVQILVKAAQSNATGVVNAGTGKETTINELIEEVTHIHGKTHPVVHAPPRKGEVYRSVLDASSAKETYHWEAKVPLSEGLKQTYAWYKNTFGS